jgi:hypothetical protein
MQTIWLPRGARRATPSAAASVAPLEVPTRDALLRGERARQAQRLVAVDRHDLVDQALGDRLLGQAAR